MGNFLTWDFWFGARPGAFINSSFKIILGFTFLLIILSVIGGIIKKKRSKSLYSSFWSSLYVLFLTNAIIGLLLVFFNYEMVPFLSSRFWLALWSVSMLIWLFSIYKAATKVPAKRQQLEKEKEFKKYIP